MLLGALHFCSYFPITLHAKPGKDSCHAIVTGMGEIKISIYFHQFANRGSTAHSRVLIYGCICTNMNMIYWGRIPGEYCISAGFALSNL